MSLTESRSVFLFRFFTLLFFAALGAAAWFLMPGKRPSETAGAGAQPGAWPAASVSGGSAPPSGAAPAGGGLAIEGSPGFRRQVTRCLRLIWEHDRDAFAFVRRYVYSVRSADKTAFGSYEGIPTVFLSDANAYRSDAWCAGIIAHHAWHSYHRAATAAGRRERGAPPPPGEKPGPASDRPLSPLSFEITTLRDVAAQEAKADGFQLRVLEAVGASESELNRVRRRAPRDLSVSHDGGYPSRP